MDSTSGCRIVYHLHLHERLAHGTAYLMDLTAQAPNWKRTIRAMGGFWQGDFTITAETMNLVEMRNLYDILIGCRIVENTAGITTWEGEVTQLELTVAGVTNRRTLAPEFFHNKVKVTYTDNASRATSATTWSEDTSSSELYGQSCYIDVVGNGYNVTAAEARRDRRLSEDAYPNSVAVGGLSSDTNEAEQSNQLRVMCAGYVFSMNRRFRENDTAPTNLSTQIATLVGESEFVTVGQIDANTLSVPIAGSEIPWRLWDGIEDMINMGDASGNRWVGGVYQDQRFYFYRASTEVSHYWENGRLLDLNHVRVPPTLIEPNIIVQIAGASFGQEPTSANTWDSPRNSYIEEVEFIAPDQYRLVLGDNR